MSPAPALNIARTIEIADAEGLPLCVIRILDHVCDKLGAAGLDKLREGVDGAWLRRQGVSDVDLACAAEELHLICQEIGDPCSEHEVTLIVHDRCNSAWLNFGDGREKHLSRFTFKLTADIKMVEGDLDDNGEPALPRDPCEAVATLFQQGVRKRKDIRNRLTDEGIKISTDNLVGAMRNAKKQTGPNLS